jgi:phospholipase C
MTRLWAGRLRSTGTFAVGIAVVVAAGSGSSVGAASRNSTPIKHVVEIMLENHSYDNLFGKFPGGDGIPAGTTLPNPKAYFDPEPAVHPVWATPNEGDVDGGIDNSRPGEQMAMDYTPGHGYAMDNYTRYPRDGMSSITEFGPSFDPNLQYAARHYELADDNFQAAIAPSNPNIHYALAATANGWMYNDLQPGTSTSTWHSIFKELDAAGLTSKLYYGLPVDDLRPPLGTYWDQLFPSDRVDSDVTTDTQFFRDLDSGKLPDFSLVRADYSDYSEEPPQDIEEGDTWLGQVLQAIAKSPVWRSAAVFITYDEGGGFWDHVSPPVKSTYGYGTRTPMVIVSAYARRGVYSKQSTNMSVLAFVQHIFGLPALNAANAAQNDLMGAFDFRRKPLPKPKPPESPADTVAFNDSTSAPSPGAKLTVNLQVNTPALTLDSSASGPVSLKLIPPAGVPAPSGFPATVTISGGKASFTMTFSTAGYYRIEANGADGILGFTTVDVGVNANTLP